MSNSINHLLSELQIHPVLLDIGASGGTPKMWEGIARHSIYIGFDPDLREIRRVSDGRFYKAMIVNSAVSADKEKRKVLFYLTKSPHCSSTLKPADVSLSEYLFSDLFSVERETLVEATSLDQVLGTFSLQAFDWFKTDSQGTDLRLFNSLKQESRAQVLAVDVEPGLIDAYVNEDLFVDVHSELIRNGFWLSNLDVQSTLRMRSTTLARIMADVCGIDEKLLMVAAKKSPAWCEARYLRTIDWLAQHSFGRREYALLWIFALLDKQLGFCLDLAIEYERLFGWDDLAREMRAEPIARLKKSRHLATAKGIARQGSRGMRWLARHLGR